jgi:hypothetical protein
MISKNVIFKKIQIIKQFFLFKKINYKTLKIKYFYSLIEFKFIHVFLVVLTI